MTSSTNDHTRLVIFDEDMGTDDAWALLMLLKAERTHNIKVLAITCVAGNTTVQNVAINTMRVLEILNRSDVRIDLCIINANFAILKLKFL